MDLGRAPRRKPTGALYPRGLCTRIPDADRRREVLYMMTEFYAPELARGVRWNDPVFGVAWPIADPTLSERDATYPDFRP